MPSAQGRDVFSYFILLITVFMAGFGGLVYLDFWLDARLHELQKLAANERIRSLIGSGIVSEIKDLHLDYYALANTSTPPGRRIIQERLSATVQTIQEALDVLEVGGRLQRRVPLNLEDRDEMLDEVVFIQPEGRKTPLEVIELEPKLAAVEARTGQLVQLLTNIQEPHERERSLQISRDILLFVKQTSPLFVRMTEDANRLYFESDRRLREIERRVKDRHRMFAIIESSMIVALLTAIFGLSVVIGKRVRYIIDRQRRAEAAIRTSEKNLKDILDTVQTGVVLIDAEDHEIVDINPAALWMMKTTRENVLGKKCHQYLCPTKEGNCPLTDKGSLCDNSEKVLVNFYGEKVPILKSAVFIEIDGKPHILESFFDISKRKNMEKALLMAKDEWERTFNALPDLISILDEGHRVIRANRAFCEKTGWDSSAGESVQCFECVHQANQPPDYCPQLLTMSDHRAHEIEHHIKELGGDFKVSATPLFNKAGEFLGSVHVARDITKEKKAEKDRLLLERQIQHTQKLESLGVLAGGIAHDFNNILTVVLGHSDLALHGLPPTSPIRRDIEEIQQASHQAADLCGQMLAYSGRGQFIIEMIDLGKVTEEMIHLLKTSISKMAQLELDFAEDLPLMQGDATEVKQIIMNLVINASEALGDNKGVITIRTGSRDCSQEFLGSLLLGKDVQPGHFVFAEITDTGCGMDENIIEKLFEPFFTTKFTGRGLGMSAVSGIIRGHRGALHVESKVNDGTRFRAFFPVVDGKSTTHQAKPPPLMNRLGREISVLLVDDEDKIRKVGANMLQRIGCRILTASNGREALDIYEKSGDEIDVVILDLTMPEIGGEKTLEFLIEADSEVRVIMSSGFSASEIAPKFETRGALGFLQKPYTIESLEDQLQKVLRS